MCTHARATHRSNQIPLYTYTLACSLAKPRVKIAGIFILPAGPFFSLFRENGKHNPACARRQQRRPNGAARAALRLERPTLNRNEYSPAQKFRKSDGIHAHACLMCMHVCGYRSERRRELYRANGRRHIVERGRE